MKLSEIARITGGELQGADIEITGVSDLEHQKEGTIAFAENKKFADLLVETPVSALIVKKDITVMGKSLIIHNEPKFAFARVLELFNPWKPHTNVPETPMNPSFPHVYIGKNVKIGKNVSILPFTTILEDTEIGDDTIIYPNCTVGSKVKIGKNCIFKSGVRIDDGTEIGDRVVVNPNSVIGGDGFGFLQKEGRNIKIPQIGRIIVKSDTEIGACVTIDRAAMGETVIGENVIIDNLVQIAHSVKIGDHSIIISQVGIGGSSTVGKNCILTGQVGVADHVHIGDGAVIMAQAGIEGDVEPKAVLFGTPARNFMEQKRIIAAWAKLPELMKRVKELEKRAGIEPAEK